MQHGGDIYKYAKKIGLNAEEMIDFSSNINCYQPEITLSFESRKIARYAESSYSSLKEVIAKKYGVKREQIALFSGATDAIYELLKSIKRGDVYLYAPLFGEYEKAALSVKKDIYRINRLQESMPEPAEKSVVVFVNPSTPEGTYYENLKELFEMWVEKRCIIIIDESFLEFEELVSIREEIQNYKRLYIIQSFSKFYSSAGVRIGAIFAHKKAIAKLPQKLWGLSSFDAEFLKWRVNDEEFASKSRAMHQVQKESLGKILHASALFDEIVPSDANFILTHSKYGKALTEHLLKEKILVRSCESFEYLSDEWLRFALKDADAHEALRVALDSFREAI